MKQAVDAALTCGYRLFDTAKYYANEKELGEAFQVGTTLAVRYLQLRKSLGAIHSSTLIRE